VKYSGKRLIIQGFIAFFDYLILTHHGLWFRAETGARKARFSRGLRSSVEDFRWAPEPRLLSFPQASTEISVFKFGTYWYCPGHQSNQLRITSVIRITS